MKIKHYLWLFAVWTSIWLASYKIINEITLKIKSRAENIISADYKNESQKYLNIIKKRFKKIEEIETFKRNIVILMDIDNLNQKEKEFYKEISLTHEEKKEIENSILDSYSKNKDDYEINYLMWVFYLKSKNDLSGAFLFFNKSLELNSSSSRSEDINEYIYQYVILEIKSNTNFKESLTKLKWPIKQIWRHIESQFNEELRDENNSKEIKNRFKKAKKILWSSL
ncbi:MAG: hypothetical protein ACD_4C00409G0004 [uncultured bacterium (gcode 4)]|uniref:Uncharacterized protein n=1 Tax=uncultured bacterium (gcode 4) TaxID=1234023 RepID=K2G7X9_9BACT|nr:MAG: hypothetical protein ACD_4C00409G0004 [uncultured bacterium (gcode 4)]